VVFDRRGFHVTEIHPTTPALDPDQTLQGDTLCASCGYNLRGLTPEMACPECGIAVGRSVFGNQLRYSDPEWVDKLRLGASLLRWAIVSNILLGLLAGAFAASRGAGSIVGLVLCIMAGLAARTLGVGAAFLVTAQEPRIALTENPITLRKVVRYCALAGLAGEVLNHMSDLGSGELAVVWTTLERALWILVVVGFLGQLVYFRRFALRLPDQKLANSTRTVMWGFAVSFAVVIAAVICMTATGAFSPGVVGTGRAATVALVAGTFAICAAVVALLVFMCWAYRLLLKYNKAFRTAADQARRFAQQHVPARRALDV